MLFPPELWSNVSLQPCISRRRFGQLLLGGVAFSACIEGRFRMNSAIQLVLSGRHSDPDVS